MFLAPVYTCPPGRALTMLMIKCDRAGGVRSTWKPTGVTENGCFQLVLVFKMFIRRNDFVFPAGLLFSPSPSTPF